MQHFEYLAIARARARTDHCLFAGEFPPGGRRR